MSYLNDGDERLPTEGLKPTIVHGSVRASPVQIPRMISARRANGVPCSSSVSVNLNCCSTASATSGHGLMHSVRLSSVNEGASRIATVR